MLEVSELRAGYGRIPILNGVSFKLSAGETLGILGHNGMGKTTLMKALMGIIPPTAGRILFAGEDLTAAPVFARARKGIGYVPQGREIFPGLSVQDNLRMGAAIAGERSQAVVDQVLAEFPRLREMRDRLGGSLSGGEQQLLAIARCLCSEPRLILLDEPTEGIQPSIIDLITDTFRGLIERRGLSLILVEQNIDVIAALCKRVLVLQRGAIVQELASAQLNDRRLFPASLLGL
jgi:branched-chain amino acid transport system ATP-binding protein